MWQGRGIGRRLATELAAALREAGVERLEATLALGSEPALALLRSCGRIESTRITDGELEAVVELV